MKTVKIYQLKNDESLRYHRFSSLKSLKSMKLNVNKKNYNCVYNSKIEDNNEDVDNFLEILFNRFNHNTDEQYKGHSMSVSDVIVVANKAYYCDSYSFEKIAFRTIKK